MCTHVLTAIWNDAGKWNACDHRLRIFGPFPKARYLVTVTVSWRLKENLHLPLFSAQLQVTHEALLNNPSLAMCRMHLPWCVISQFEASLIADSIIYFVAFYTLH